MLRVFAALLMAFLAWGAAARSVEWETLSAGENLKGWRAEGGDWSVKDGVIAGRAGKDENCWLIWEKAYADLELELEFRTLAPTNGGVQFRSHWLPRVPLKEGEAAADAPRQMYGYQANVETRQRLATGRLVDENGRGPLAETPMEAALTLKQRDWNRMRVVARGPVIEVYLHEALAHRTEDEAYLSGFIALQVFAFGQDEGRIEYRNIRVKDLGRSGKWRALFDGKSLAGWREYGAEDWSVADGAIVGKSGPKKSEGYLATEEEWADFRIRASFKMLGEGNFGLFYHSSIRLREKDGYPLIAGVQAEVEPGYPSKTGFLYESYARGWLEAPALDKAGAVALRPADWNELEVRQAGNRTTTWLNGVRVLALEDAEAKYPKGFFALQLHANGVDGILWKDLLVAE